MSNVGKRWSDSEETQLLQEIKEGESIESISKKHQRNIGGIKARLADIAFKMYLSGKSQEDITQTVGISDMDEIIKEKKLLIRKRIITKECDINKIQKDIRELENELRLLEIKIIK